MANDREIWDQRYRQREWQDGPPSDFAADVASRLTGASDLLELGCATGWDAAYFARLGHRVTGTDFSEAAVGEAATRYAGVEGLTFAVLDIAWPFELDAAAYDVVYARLSLHYFDDATTRRVFDDIARVLRSGGLLAFMCKSTNDPQYGRGEPRGPDMFFSHHQRHFFSEAYTRDVLTPRFDVESLVMRSGELYEEPSAWVEVFARKH